MSQPLGPPLGLGIIGLGSAVEPHARALAELAGRATVLRAATRSQARANTFTARFGIPATTDLDELLYDEAIGAVLVLTPPASHLDVAAQCFVAGKHVLIEKPIETVLERGERMVALGRAAGLRLGVVLQHRFRPGSLRLREVLAAGTIGEIQAASMIVPWWRPQNYYDEPGRGTLARDGGGVLLTQAIHTLDLFRSLVGISAVGAAQARTTAVHRMETEDYVSALVRLGNGAPGTVLATTAAYPGGPERIEIIGAEGTASLIGGSLRVQLHDGSEEILAAEGPTGAGANIMDFPIDAHRALLADFVDAIAADRDPAIPGEEALATQQVVQDIIGAAMP